MKAGATSGESCGAGGDGAASFRSGPRVATARRGWPGSVSMIESSDVLLESNPCENIGHSHKSAAGNGRAGGGSPASGLLW